MRGLSIFQLVRGGLIAALYAVLALSLPEFSYGIVQFRLSEALVLLPLYLPEAVPGLIIGCFLANLSSPFGIIDILGGTLCTALAAVLTRRLRHTLVPAALAPILINGLGVSIYVALLSSELYLAVMPMIALSEAVVVIGLAVPVSLLVARTLRLKEE